MLKRLVMGLVVSCTATAASAAVIAGGVYEDRPALALRANFQPLRGVTVKLYRDDGSNTPSANDTLVTSTKTSDAGMYTFDVRAGSYWVAVDSRSIHASAWAEQTFGPAGSLCARPNGSTVSIPLEGACFGGRTTNADDASTLMTAEHLAAVALRDETKAVDFAFSFDTVTVAVDGARVQGSIRQFIENANAIAGPNRMRFVPIAAAPEQRKPIMGVPPRWWSITFTTPLPALRDEDTLLDGTAYNFLSPASVSNVHPGRIGDRASISIEDLAVPRLEKPELELVVTGSEGIACDSRCGLRSFALKGSTIGIALRADARIEHVIIGAAPDAEPGTTGTVGLQLERGLAAAYQVMITAQSNLGIAVTPNGRLDGEHLDVSHCGTPASGGGIALLSNDSVIRRSAITANLGAGIIIGNPSGTQPAHGNTIDGSTISTNQAGVLISAGSMRNTITRNDIMWNRFGGVTVAPSEANPPRENRISANRFDENGVRPIVFDLQADPNKLAERENASPCGRRASAVNGGIGPPQIQNVHLVGDSVGYRVVVRGQACPGEVIEVYQSFVTSGVRDVAASEAPMIRGDKTMERETITNQRREMGLPSIGEFNYVGSTTTKEDGSFEASFPFHFVKIGKRPDKRDEADIWITDVLRSYDPADRAFSAIAIDRAGNTSEMSVRRQIDK
jgi:Right handed beta helix region